MDKLKESGRAITIDPINPASEAQAIAKIKECLGLS
jgi:hypothetical protein